MASSSSSSATIPVKKSYDVFLSFRGEDTRSGFISHLHEALISKQISTFIDYDLERGDGIFPSLLTAIEESMISVIIFSQNYANSKSCLKELEKIFQCKEHNGQIVIPVFYGVDPSDVKKQNGKFGDALDELKERLAEGEMDLNKVRSLFKEAATISGWNSQDISPESELIKSIVGDILNKFNRMKLNFPSNLVGIGSHVERVESLLCLDLPEFRKVGIWGMSGIGKTTIAQSVYNHIWSRFDGFCFVEKVSEKLKNQSVDDLRKKIVLELFQEESLNMGSRTLHLDFIMKQLKRKRVLIVLDDVDDANEAIKLLLGENDRLFSEGSRILVTSKDRQVLKNIVGDENFIYKVEGLNEEDSLQLFSLCAFKQNHPISNRLVLSNKVLSYARGHPLALVVLGHALFEKSDEEWHSALSSLGKESFTNIEKVLKISYDALCEEEKMIFLDIASFLVGKKWDFVLDYYKGCVNRIEFKISNLVDKCLITRSGVFEKTLEMHDLLKEMGRSIEKTLKMRRRILDLKDVTQEESSMIEAISVNLSQCEEILEFDCSLLSNMESLKFLEIYRDSYRFGSKVRFCWKRFTGISDELKYLSWDGYPHKSFPSKFCAENLIELHMPNSEIRKLWRGKQNIVNLKVINLRGAKKLVKFPDVSKGRNIEEIDLWECESLVKVSPSVHDLPKLKRLLLQKSRPTLLKYLSLQKSGPTKFDSKVLETLYLCGDFNTFPQLALEKVICFLEFVDTCITELPSSIELLRGLEGISIERCNKLSIISTNICKLKSLTRLRLRTCTNLESFPEIMEPMESLIELDLSGCLRLRSFPNNFHNLKSLEMLRLDDTAITELPSSIQHLVCLKTLDIRSCRNIRSVPKLGSAQLEHLLVNGCSNLTSIPELPSSLEFLDADGCVSLKTISSVRFTSSERTRLLSFINCLNWDEEERRRVLDNAISNLSQGILMDQELKILLPWSEIPQSFPGIQSVGSSLTLKIPMDDGLSYGFAFCVVINPVEEGRKSSLTLKILSLDDDGHKSLIEENIYFSNQHYHYRHLQGTYLMQSRPLKKYLKHMFMWYEADLRYQTLKKYGGREVSLHFLDYRGKLEVTRCGVAIVPLKDNTEY